MKIYHGRLHKRDCIAYQCNPRQMYTKHALCKLCISNRSDYRRWISPVIRSFGYSWVCYSNGLLIISWDDKICFPIGRSWAIKVTCLIFQKTSGLRLFGRDVFQDVLHQLLAWHRQANGVHQCCWWSHCSTSASWESQGCNKWEFLQ